MIKDEIVNTAGNLIKEGIRDRRVYTGPVHLELSLTNKCNYDCFFCRYDKGDAELDWLTLKRVLSELKDMGLKNIKVSGEGEQLLYGKFTEFLDFISIEGMNIDVFVTNGSLIDKAFARRLVESKIDLIHVSMNVDNREDYASIMGVSVDSFDRVVDAVSNLVEIRKKLRKEKPLIAVQFMVYKRNYKRVKEIVQFSKSLGIDFISLRDMYLLPLSYKLDTRETADLAERIKDCINKDDGFVKLVFPNTKVGSHIDSQKCNSNRHFFLESAKKTCYVGWYNTALSADGSVYPCCNIMGVSRVRAPLGNVYENNFIDIWQGDKYNKFRQESANMPFFIKKPHEFKFIGLPCNSCCCRNGIFDEVNGILEWSGKCRAFQK